MWLVSAEDHTSSGTRRDAKSGHAPVWLKEPEKYFGRYKPCLSISCSCIAILEDHASIATPVGMMATPLLTDFERRMEPARWALLLNQLMAQKLPCLWASQISPLMEWWSHRNCHLEYLIIICLVFSAWTATSLIHLQWTKKNHLFLPWRRRYMSLFCGESTFWRVNWGSLISWKATIINQLQASSHPKSSTSLVARYMPTLCLCLNMAQVLENINF